MPLARRLKLLAWAHEQNAVVLEDDYDSEYRYEDRPLESIHGLDVHGRVVYLGTFSKVLFPSLRLGYVVLPPDLVPAFLAREVAFRPPGVRPRAERGRRAPSIGRVRPAPAARSRPQRVSEGGSPRSAPEPVVGAVPKSPAPTPEFTWWCGFPSALPRIWTHGYPPPRKPESGSMRLRRIISRRRLAQAYSSVTGASTKRRSRRVSGASRRSSRKHEVIRSAPLDPTALEGFRKALR